jgi:hypothetical protein
MRFRIIQLNHMSSLRIVLATTFSLVLLAVNAAAAEPSPSSAASPVQKASFNRSPSREGRQRVTFDKRPARVGDEVEQTLGFELRMATTIRRGNQLGDKSRTTARNDQRRVVKTTHVEADRTAAVRVQYLEATKQLTAAEGAQPAQSLAEASKTPQPVAGKTYFCQRLPGDDGALAITDEEGHIPPMDEFEIVAQHMEMVGRPNPLAEFLAGKSVIVGQTIELPKEVAGKIFNLGEQFGEITQFALTLKKVASHDGATQAEFLAHVEAASSNASQMRLELEGPLTAEVDTSRAVKVDLSGPIAMSETRGSYSTSYQVIGTGRLKLSVASAYRDAKR